ncbi:MAG: SDR family NAD(P)-dependent oxidoreductase [Bacteroidales bacterium]|nr:SDR family NAD(P)-dependent oxidoreductase [Bacteroidales bacterium]
MNKKKWLERFQEAYGHRPCALITGGSSGMGLEYARQLAEIGCNLLLVSNQELELQKAAEDLKKHNGIQVVTRFQDLADEKAADDLLAFCQSESLQIDILINNAGMFFFEELTRQNEAKALTMMRLHVFTPTRLCVLFGEEMKKHGYGYIINMSSMAAKLPCPGITIYSATKAYLKSFSKSLFFEMHPYGVGVTTVCPAAIATPLYKLKPSLLKFGVKIGVIGTPQWLVRRALKGMMRKKRVVKPGFMNIYLPPLIALLPHKLVARLWQKFK